MISEKTEARIIAFRDDRDWLQFHNPKDLAISVSLEAAELLENFQWSAADTEVEAKREHIAEELADVLIYCELLCNRMGFHADEIVNKKLAQNEAKYSIEKAKGSKKKYTEL